MSAFSFRVAIVPIGGLLAHFGHVPAELEEYKPMNPDTYVERDDYPNYWSPRQLEIVLSRIATLYSERPSWSEDARMFTDKKAVRSEVWNDGVKFQIELTAVEKCDLEFIVDLARSNACVLVQDEGLTIPAEIEVLREAMLNSRPAKNVIKMTGKTLSF